MGNMGVTMATDRLAFSTRHNKTVSPSIRIGEGSFTNEETSYLWPNADYRKDDEKE
jgi:hypothetical protein